MYILSQVLIVISDILCILSMLSKNKKMVVFYLTFSTILFGAHYVCLFAWTGAAIAGVELIFLILMYLLEYKNKTQYNSLLSIITIIATVALSIITWGGYISLLPMLSMVIYLITMMFKNVIIVKSGVFTRIALNAIYLVFITYQHFGQDGVNIYVIIQSLYELFNIVAILTSVLFIVFFRNNVFFT